MSVKTALESAASKIATAVSGKRIDQISNVLEPQLKNALENHLFDPMFKGHRGRAIRAFYKENAGLCNLMASAASWTIQGFEPPPGLLKTAHEALTDSINEILRRARGDILSRGETAEIKEDLKKIDKDVMSPGDISRAIASVKALGGKGVAADELAQRTATKQMEALNWITGLPKEKREAALRKGVLDQLLKIEDVPVRETTLQLLMDQGADKKKGEQKTGLALRQETLDLRAKQVAELRNRRSLS